jgi:phosphate transport system substrate-binding protein
MRRAFVLLVISLILSACGPAPAKPAARIEDRGSDTLVNLALAWAEAYQTQHPETSVSVSGGGTGVGLTALANGTIEIANASRRITPDEVQQARSKGIDPMAFVVARDAIAVIVHPQNPVSRLSLSQLSDIYSGRITSWSEVGGEDRPIVRLSRETNSGTHVYFLEAVVRLGQKGNTTLFSPDTLLLPSSEGIVNEVRQNPNAIGYDGLGYVPDDLKVVALAREAQGPFVLPSAATVDDGTYPVSRELYMYTAGPPAGALADYLAWILSPQAQAIVADLGFVPVRPEQAP